MRPALRRPLPATVGEITAIQSAGKRRAVEQARRAPYFKDKLAHVDLTRLDDPAEWAKLPILDKDMLRELTDAQFYNEFCLPATDVSEFWRSGGSTGRPLFYPRNQEDMRHAMASFGRLYDCLGLAPGERAHCSFPLGIHPVGQMLARSAQTWGLGVNWAGAGTTTPSGLQLELIERLRPTLWMGMSSYGLHLAHARIEQFVLRIESVAATIFFDQLSVGIGRGRISIERFQIGTRRRGVQVPVEFLDVFAMVSLRAGQAEESFLEDRVPSVPHGHGQGQSTLPIGDAQQAVFAPPVGPAAGLVVAEVPPRRSIR